MENIKLRAFQMKDLSEVIDCWNESLIYDVINEERFKHMILLDENFREDLFQVALLDNTIVGFCYGVKRKVPYLERGLEEKRGWIVMMGVRLQYQRQGIGTLLYQKIEKTLKALGTQEITLCAYSPNYFCPGIDKRYQKAIAFFEKKGYIYRNDSVSMKKDLWDYQMSQTYRDQMKLLEERNIRFVSYQDRYMLELLNFLLKNFGAGWKYNALNAMKNDEAQDTILLAVNQEDHIIGFCMRKIDGHDSRFGPFGVSEELRSQGIGGVLFEYMMQQMKQKAIYHLYFLWTDGAAQRFYQRHGVEVCRTYQLYRKEVEL